MNRRKLAKTLLPILFLSVSVQAFDLRTHLYVANEVQKDLEDGVLSIPPFGDFTVDPAIVTALKKNQPMYMYGALGPDLAPDFIGGQVTVHPGLPGGWKADDWLRYLASPPPGIDSQKWQAYLLGYYNHVAADVFAHSYVNMYAGDVFDMKDEDNLNVEARHKALEVFIAKHQPYQIDASADSALGGVWQNDKLAIKAKLISNSEVATQYQQSGSASYLYSMKMYEDKMVEAAKPLQVLRTTVLGIIKSNKDRETFYNKLIIQYDQDLAGTANQLKIEQDLLNKLRNNQPPPQCLTTGKPSGCGAPYLPCIEPPQPMGCKTLTEIQQWQIANQLNIDKQQLVVNGLQEVKNFYEKHPDLAAAADALGLGRPTRQQAIEALVLVGAVIVFASELDAKVLALNFALAQQNAYLAQVASADYIQANINTAIGLINNPGSPDVLKPLTEWLICYGPLYAVNKPIASIVPTFCQVMPSIKNLQEQLKKSIQNTVADTAAMSAYQAYKDMQQKLINISLEYGEQAIKGVLSEEEKQMLQWLNINSSNDDESDSALNATYLLDGGPAKLIKISDIARRVKAEMHLDANGKFDPKEYAPIYNAIQLSKLTLLSEADIHRIEIAAGAEESNFSQSYNQGKFNIILGWISSLDGHEQWMQTSPFAPRQPGYIWSPQESNSNFGVGSGFIWWVNQNSRQKVFNKIFKGPISAALEAPETLGLAKFANNYTQSRDCISEPFPTAINFEYCRAFYPWLVPILFMMN